MGAHTELVVGSRVVTGNSEVSKGECVKQKLKHEMHREPYKDKGKSVAVFVHNIGIFQLCSL